MRILITGAAGMLGQDVQLACQAAGHEALALARAELDITDPESVAAAFTGARCDAVINCAAWTNVDGAEEHRERALAANGTGAGYVAQAAIAAGAWTVHVSSDYVFNGTKAAPYLESDPVDPVSVYGSSKLEGELEVARHAPDTHTIVRSAWLFGTGGKCFPKTILRVAGERDEITVVDDQVGCPTFTGHLAPALVQLATDPIAGVVHVAGGGQCSWFEFATEIVKAGGLDCEVRGVDTSQYPTPARRPAYSVLRSERGAPELPAWREGLAEFMTLNARVAA
jgi:dTDP-4-dehydrorhamnose reductase